MTKRTILPLIATLALLGAAQHSAIPHPTPGETQATAACTPKPIYTPLAERAEGEANEQTLKGIIVAVRSLSGASVIAVRRNNGMIIEVDLTQDTIIKPFGAELRRGMHVTVKGQTVGCVFTAQEIETSFY